MSWRDGWFLRLRLNCMFIRYSLKILNSLKQYCNIVMTCCLFADKNIDTYTSKKTTRLALGCRSWVPALPWRWSGCRKEPSTRSSESTSGSSEERLWTSPDWSSTCSLCCLLFYLHMQYCMVSDKFVVIVLECSLSMEPLAFLVRCLLYCMYHAIGRVMLDIIWLFYDCNYFIYWH
jgi:hypothetical protein